MEEKYLILGETDFLLLKKYDRGGKARVARDKRVKNPRKYRSKNGEKGDGVPPVIRCVNE